MCACMSTITIRTKTKSFISGNYNDINLLLILVMYSMPIKEKNASIFPDRILFVSIKLSVPSLLLDIVLI
jgi:hypothetical protein